MRKFIFIQQKKILNKPSFSKNGAGFTLMEIVVATTIFALVGTAMMGLFNYTLKINRRTEALRQATQGMRTFVEGLVKQVRNGQVYYGLDNSFSPPTPAVDNSTVCGAGAAYNRYYQDKENRLRITDTDGADVCFYLANSLGAYVNAGNFSGSQLIMEKNVGSGYVKQVLSPSNFYVDNLVFFVRPVCDPYNHCDAASGNIYSPGQPPKIQPSVSIFLKLRVLLATGETVRINYQTSVSSNKYDIPNVYP
jgi:type II secretory pathway pseudopilin PulG